MIAKTLAILIVFAAMGISALSAQDIHIECRWGLDGKSILDTKQGTLTADMGDCPAVMIPFNIIDTEKAAILEEAIEVGFFSFPHRLPDSLIRRHEQRAADTPALIASKHHYCRVYFVRIETPTDTNWVEWSDCQPPLAPWIKYLRRVHRRIRAIVEARPEYKALPSPCINMHDVMLGNDSIR